MCINPKELDMIVNQYELFNKVLMVGFNRRFSPLILREIFVENRDGAKSFCNDGECREYSESIGSKIQRLEADE